jgi:hypothetical protein
MIMINLIRFIITEERYWALFYMPLYTSFYTICWMYWYRLQIKCDYKKLTRLYMYTEGYRHINFEQNFPPHYFNCLETVVLSTGLCQPTLDRCSKTCIFFFLDFHDGTRSYRTFCFVTSCVWSSKFRQIFCIHLQGEIEFCEDSIRLYSQAVNKMVTLYAHVN